MPTEEEDVEKGVAPLVIFFLYYRYRFFCTHQDVFNVHASHLGATFSN